MAGQLNTFVVAAVVKRPKGANIQTHTVSAVLKRHKGANIQTHTVSAVLTPPVEIAVVNGGAEECDLTGWTVDSGAPGTRTAKPSPYEGSCYFYGGNTSFSGMHQIVTLSPDELTKVQTGEYCVRAEWAQISYSGFDYAQVAVELLDSSDTLLHSHSSIMHPAPLRTSPWDECNILTNLPTTTAKIKFIVNWDRRGGTNSDGYIDALKLYISKTPANEGIRNPGGEEPGSTTSSIVGWNNDHGRSGVSSGVYAHSGSYGIKVQDKTTAASKYARISQFVRFSNAEKTLISSGGADFDFTYWHRSYNGTDEGKVTLYIYSATGVRLVTIDSGWDDGSSTWAEHTLSSTNLPTDAVGFQILLSGHKLGGNSMDAYFDDLSYTVVNLVPPKVADKKHTVYAPVKRAPAISDYAYKMHVVLQEVPTFKERVTKVYTSIQPASATREYSASSYAVMFDPPNIMGHDIAVYNAMKRPPRVREYSGAALAVIADPNNYVYKQLGTTVYKLIAKLETDKLLLSAVYKHKSYAETSKLIATAVCDPGFRPFFYTYNTASYAALVEPLDPPLFVKTHDYTPYAIIQPPIVTRLKKTQAYAMWWTPPIVKQMTKKIYSIIRESEEQLRTWEVDGYAVIHFDGDFRDRKQTGYAALTKLPPIKEFSTSAYTIFIEPGEENSYKNNAYALLFYPLNRANRVVSYGVLRANNCALRKNNNYALFHTFNALSLDKVNDYAILQYYELPTKSRKLSTYVIVKENPYKKFYEKTQKTYVVHGEKQPLVAANSFTSYLCLGSWPFPVMMFNDVAGYCMYEGQYHRLWDTTSYVVLWEAPTKFVKNYKRCVYAVHGTPPEVTNDDYHKTGGYVRN